MSTAPWAIACWCGGAQDGVGGCGTSQPVDVSTECAFVDVVTGADDQESGVGDVSQLGGVVDHAVGVVGSVGVDEDRAIGRHDGGLFHEKGVFERGGVFV